MQDAIKYRRLFTAVAILGLVGAAAPALGQLKAGDHYSANIDTPQGYKGVTGDEPRMTWRYELCHRGATYIAIHFVDFDLAPGDYLVVSDPDGNQSYTMEGLGKMDAGTFWAQHIKGDTVYLELVQVNHEGGRGFLIDEYVAGFLNLGHAPGDRAICGTDDKEHAVCYQSSHPTEYDRGRAVCRLLSGGSAYCTGWLVSADNHVITNEHCITSASDALNTDYDFMAEAPNCSDPDCSECYPGTVYSGATFIQDSYNLDYALVRVNSGNPSDTHGYLEIDNRVATVGEEIYIPQHPGGRAKAFAMYSTDSHDPGGVPLVYSITQPACQGSGYSDVGYYADTEGGSSGSPVLARDTHKVIALHHCADCPNRGVPIHLIYPEIAEYLYPGSAGVITLDSGAYSCDGLVGVELKDGDIGASGSHNIIVTTTGGDSETVTLTETGADTAIFEGSIATSSGTVTTEDGTLQVAHGQTITATYIDADDGQGGVNVPVTDIADVDCQAPAILDVQTTDVAPRSATVSIDSDEPIRGTVYYGESCASLTGTAVGAGYADPGTVNVTGLDDSTTYFYTVEVEDEAGNSNTDDNGGACYSFSTPDIPDFFTEEFVSDNDLDNLSLFFTPNGSYDYYYGCVEEEITELPTDPSGGTTLSLSDDDYETVNLSGAQVSIYGTSYGTFYPSSNGYITFVHGDTDYDESLAEHFTGVPRISGIYDDLDPAQAGTVSWKQLADRAVVTWSGVTEHNSSNSNTFQIEMYFDGKIVISYLSVAAADGIAGLSEGEGLDPDFYETDLSDMGPCGPQPPDAFSGSADTAVETPVTISLQANDDGLPDPPAALTYIVTTLPGHGTLYDTGDSSEITSVPYTLYNYGNQVDYHPEAAFHDTDTFQFMANDGGTPVEGGGDSNTAVITITVGGPAWDPVAYNVDWGTGLSVPADIELSGSDPNSDPLTFVIESLPPAGEGYLSDPGAGLIETVPYTLVSGGDVVRYHPPYGQYLVTDFEFSAWDATTGSNVATVTVTVGVPQVIHSFDLDTDPGWSTEEQWEFGQPTGGGSHNGDPSSGYTGQNVYGYNLSGDYALGMMETYYLTTTAIDCSSVTGTELRFQRWLGVEAGYWDQAIIEVSNNGVDWTPVWEHVGGSSTINESSWSLQSYDISSVADDEATVYLRWGMGPTDTSTTYPGWNLDDIEIWGGYELPPGDFNADLAVDLVDYVSFVDCMAGPDVPPNPQEPLSSEDHCLGAFDFDEDSDVDLDDFGGFQAYFGS